MTRATYICGVTPDAAVRARLQDVGPGCPEAAGHAPMPAGYGPWEEVAIRRANARQRQRRCPGCGLWAVWEGGKDVPGWPRTTAVVEAQRELIAAVGAEG
ncbi:MAG TPA: hypothetical protein VF024_11190 [Solirubrobacteraceae bacterium]